MGVEFVENICLLFTTLRKSTKKKVVSNKKRINLCIFLITKFVLMCECAVDLGEIFVRIQKCDFQILVLPLVAVFIDNYAWKIPVAVYIKNFGRCHLVWDFEINDRNATTGGNSIAIVTSAYE